MSGLPLDALLLAELAAERLAEDGLGGAEIYGALDRIPEQGALRDTLALVLPAAETAAENRAGRAGALQRETLEITVAISVRAANDPRGRRALAALREPRDEARRLLSGWIPEGRNAATALACRGGRLAEIDGGRVWWQDDYQLEVWAEAPPRR